MLEFKFQTPTKVVFGPDTVKNLGAEVKALDIHKVLVVTDEGIITAGLLKRVEGSFRSTGIEFEVFDKIEPNPKETTIQKGAQYLKDTGAQAVVGFGGGSPMDAAKAISVMCANDGDIEEYCSGFDPWPVPPMPIFAVPTSAGTGSEVSAAALVSVSGKSRKMSMVGSTIRPQIAVVDPMFTVGLSPKLTALTGIDALSHAVEAYITKGANPFSDLIAERAIALVADNLILAYQDGNNLEARSNLMLASTLAVIAASNAGLGIIHALAHALGGRYDLPHGLTIALCFAQGLAYNHIAAQEKCARVSQLLGTNTSGLVTRVAAESVVQAIQTFIRRLNITDNLQSLDIQEKDFETLAEIAMQDGSTPRNARPARAKDFLNIYENMYQAVM